MCLLCGEGPETTIHALKDCHEAQVFWKSFRPLMAGSLFYGSNLIEWLRLNCLSSKVSPSSGINWEIIFPFGIWSLWLRRNNIIFRNENYRRNLKANVLSKAIEFAFIGISGKQARSRTKIQVRWTNPL